MIKGARLHNLKSVSAIPINRFVVFTVGQIDDGLRRAWRRGAAPVYGIAGQVGSGRTDVALRLTLPEDLRDPFATVIERR